MEKCQEHRLECQIRSGFWSQFLPCISLSLLIFKPGVRVGWGFGEIIRVRSTAECLANGDCSIHVIYFVNVCMPCIFRLTCQVTKSPENLSISVVWIGP